MKRDEVLEFIYNILGKMSAKEIDNTEKMNPIYNEVWQYIKNNLK